MSLRHGAVTDVGRMRKNNQDRFLSLGRLAAVADGMGGHRAGEVASQIAIEELKALQQAGPWPSEAAVGEALRTAFLQANQRIREMSAGDRDLEGMGTTLVALLEHGDSVHLANVGDSRAYLLRHGELSQVTVDHSLVQELVDEGRLRPEEAGRHPQRSIITRALGVDADVEVDLFTYKLQHGDRLLLCTDGLSGVVDETRIRNVLLRIPDPQHAAEQLVEMANESGGPDNITAIVLDTEDRTARAGEATGDLGAGVTGTIVGGVAGENGDGDRAGYVTGPFAAGAGRAGRHRRGANRGAGGRRRGRRVLLVLGVVIVLAAALVGGRALVFSRYWVGFDRGQVAVFRGVPGNVAGLHFSGLVQRTPINRDQVPAGYALQLDSGISAESLADARKKANCAPLAFTELAQSCTGVEPATTTSAPPTTVRPTTTTKRATTTTKAKG